MWVSKLSAHQSTSNVGRSVKQFCDIHFSVIPTTVSILYMQFNLPCSILLQFWSNIFLSMASLVLCMQLRHLFYEIKKKLAKHRSYVRIIKCMESRWVINIFSQVYCSWCYCSCSGGGHWRGLNLGVKLAGRPAGMWRKRVQVLGEMQWGKKFIS